jgi:hypothetical protein
MNGGLNIWRGIENLANAFSSVPGLGVFAAIILVISREYFTRQLEPLRTTPVKKR